MSVKKKIAKLISERPDYKISEQYYDNQALARTAAFGRDNAIRSQEENLEQESADAMATASQYSNSASGILSTLSSITNSKNQALRNLAADEATIQRQKLQDLYGANVDLAEEEDKEFEYDVNMPYQKKLEMLQEKKRRRQQLADAAIGWGTGVAGLSTVFGGNSPQIFGGGQSSSGGGYSGVAGGGPTYAGKTTEQQQSDDGYYQGYSGGKGGGGALGIIGSIFSDERLKKNSEPTKYGLDEVLDMKVMEYEYITDPVPAQRHVGLMAQNVLDKVPEAVDQSGKYLKINYNELVPVLIKAMQEQQVLINKLAQEISEFKQSA